MSRPLNELGVAINEVNRMNGWEILTPEVWENPHKIPAALALIHSEVSEALEAFRKNDHTNFCEELADVIIRVLNLSDGLGINMDAEVAMKLELNRTRGFRHGGKKI